MEGSRLTHDQTRYIFEINTIGIEKEVLNVDDVIETANHFRCIDIIIDHAKAVLTEKFIKELHLFLKNGTGDSRKDWFAVGEYKKLPNEVGGRDTALPEEIADKMKALLTEYNDKEEKTFEDILDFHVKFERIHPFQNGNGSEKVPINPALSAFHSRFYQQFTNISGESDLQYMVSE